MLWEGGGSWFGSHSEALFHMSAKSAIPGISEMNSGELRNYISYKTQDGGFSISGSEQACCVCVRLPRVSGVLFVLLCVLIV